LKNEGPDQPRLEHRNEGLTPNEVRGQAFGTGQSEMKNEGMTLISLGLTPISLGRNTETKV